MGSYNMQMKLQKVETIYQSIEVCMEGSWKNWLSGADFSHQFSLPEYHYSAIFVERFWKLGRGKG